MGDIIEELVDKTAIMQVFGCIMQEPLLLAQIDKYRLDINDFHSRFTKIIYSGLYNMYTDGARVITPLDIDNYLNTYKDLKIVFDENNGIQYIQDCEEIADTINFNYYYQRVKKFSALRALKKDGFDISDFYCTDILNRDYSKIQERFDSLSVSDIFSEIKKKLFGLEERYVTSSTSGSSKASDGLMSLKEQYKRTPEIGYPLQGEIYNTVVRGARKGKYYLRSAPTGAGKTRMMVGDACHLAIPIYYDLKSKQWENRGYAERCLIITTELDKDEIQTLIIACVSGVNEDVILNGTYTFDEEQRVDKAIQIIEEYSDYLQLEKMPDPNIVQIEAVVRKQCLVNGVQNVFYDYIFSSPSLLNEFGALKIREDVALMLLSTSLKDLATELNVFMMSSTQLSGDFENKRGIRNQQFLRGAKSISDKCDVGVITTWIGQEESQIMQGLINQLNCEMPNYVTDVYKARRSKYKNIKIWSKVDLGTCRVEDICITDGYYNPITDFVSLEFRDGERDIVIQQFSTSEPERGNENIQEEKQEVVKKKPSLDDF